MKTERAIAGDCMRSEKRTTLMNLSNGDSHVSVFYNGRTEIAATERETGRQADRQTIEGILLFQDQQLRKDVERRHGWIT